MESPPGADRDPRIDPRPGDIVAKQLKKVVVFREVTGRTKAPPGWSGLGRYRGTPHVQGERVHYAVSHRSWTFGDGVHIGSWISWCRDAAVIKKEGHVWSLGTE